MLAILTLFILSISTTAAADISLDNSSNDDIASINDEINIEENEISDDSFNFTDRSSIKKAVSKGLAYATLPRLMSYDDIYVTSGMIIPVSIADTNLKLTLFLAYPARGNLPHSVTIVLEAIRSIFQRMTELFAIQEYSAEDSTDISLQNQYLLY